MNNFAVRSKALNLILLVINIGSIGMMPNRDESQEKGFGGQNLIGNTTEKGYYQSFLMKKKLF